MNQHNFKLGTPKLERGKSHFNSLALIKLSKCITWKVGHPTSTPPPPPRKWPSSKNVLEILEFDKCESIFFKNIVLDLYVYDKELRFF